MNEHVTIDEIAKEQSNYLKSLEDEYESHSAELVRLEINYRLGKGAKKKAELLNQLMIIEEEQEEIQRQIDVFDRNNSRLCCVECSVARIEEGQYICLPCKVIHTRQSNSKQK